MDSSPGFGSTPCDSKRPVQTRFRYGSVPSALNLATRSNSPAHSSISTPSQLPALTACRRTVSGSFHPPSGVLFTFPSRYSFTIGRREYFALEGGPPSFPRNSTCSAVLTNASTGAGLLSPTRLSLSSAVHSRDIRLEAGLLYLRPNGSLGQCAVQPPPRNACRLSHASGLGSSAFAHHY